MRQNAYFRLERESRSFRGEGEKEFQEEIQFKNRNYAFPNDVQVCQRCKSFKTTLEINKRSIPEIYTKKLSMLNRSHFTVKLKQLKKQEDLVQNNKNVSRLLLYYEAIPYSMEYAKEGPLELPLSSSRLEKYLNEVIGDLVESNIYNQFTIANCGFGESGEFRVFIPPTFVLYDKKLSLSDKQVMISSAQLIIQYWGSDLPKTILRVYNKHHQNKSSYLTSPQAKKDVQNEQQRPHRKSEQETTDIKKTIKLSKNYVKQIYDRIEEEKSKKTGRLHELKKAKSMEALVNVDEVKQRRCGHFLDKINQLNKKLVSIRENFIRKKSGNEVLKLAEVQATKTKMDTELQQSYKMRNDQHYNEEVIFDKYQEMIPERSPKKKPNAIQKEEDGQSIDTYLQEMRGEDGTLGYRPLCEMRKTALPSHMANQLQSEEAKNSNWHHESAGNLIFKRFIQKNKERYPELFDQKDNTSLSKISAMNASERKKLKSEAPRDQKAAKLKKMLSMETFQNQLETNSIHLSEYSNQLSNVKRRKEKQIRNRQIKQKVQDILMKSKKAIELLKSPPKANQG